MRISCPNCEAEYEVSADVIPDDGRDVQCSNCGQTWFVDPREKDAPDFDPAAKPEPRPRRTPRAYPPAEAQANAAPRRGTVPHDVQSVLRQEAAREMAARQAEADADMARQDEFALDPPQAEQPQARGPETTATSDPTSRRHQLPDIEEINSSLAATTTKAIPAPAASAEEIALDDARRTKGFRLGFVTALLILAVLVGLYLFAPQITDAAPQLADHVNTYVFFINDIRQWMFESTERLLIYLQSLAEGTAE